MICEILETTHKPKELTNKLINQTQNSSDRIMNKCIYRSHLHALVEHRHYYDFLCRWFRRHCASQLRKCKFKFRSTKSSTSRFVVVVVIIVNWSAAQLDNILYIYLCLFCMCIAHLPTRKAAATPEALLLIFNICWWFQFQKLSSASEICVCVVRCCQISMSVALDNRVHINGTI